MSAFWSIRRRPISSKAAHVLGFKPQQVKRIEARRRLTVAEQQVKVRQALEAVRHGLAIEHDALEGEGAHCRRDRDELARPVAAVAGPQAHALAVLEREDAEAVVLQFMQPAVAVRHVVGEGRLARHDEPRGGSWRFSRTQRCGVRINIDASLAPGELRSPCDTRTCPGAERASRTAQVFILLRAGCRFAT